MRSVTVKQAQADLPALIEAAAAGEDVLIANEGGPAFKLVAVPSPEEKPKRFNLGYLKGQVWISDDFNDPLPDDLLNAFYGEGQ